MNKISKAVKNPKRAVNYFARKSNEKRHFGTAEIRSLSDDGSYVPFVIKAANNPAVFERFRSNPAYRRILEHVTESNGQKYLDRILVDNPGFIDRIDDIKQNDFVGAPITYKYPKIGEISPTTLRYLKVASDLKKYFGPKIGSKIVEIGVGYGGQMLIIDKLFDVTEYHLYDLPPVLDLVSMYLESYLLNSSYKTVTINQNSGDDSYDLAISNYALSELPSKLQITYIRKILSRARRGYLTMNSGRTDSVFQGDKLLVEELRVLLPPFEIFEEAPLTGRSNYLVVWGT
jgi:putative sugar O-methyltransferase